MTKRVRMIALALCVMLAGLGLKCGDKTQRERDLIIAKDIATAFAKAEPLVLQLRPDLKAFYHPAVVASQSLIVAIDKSDAATAVQLLRELVPIITATAATFADNPKVLAILALADIGIGILLNHLPEAVSSAPGAPGAPVDVLLQYKQQRRWGCDYRPEKCK